MYNGLNIAYSIKVLGILDTLMNENESRPPSYTTHKKNSKLMKDLNVRPKTIKILEENIGSKISDTACSNIFSDLSQSRETK